MTASSATRASAAAPGASAGLEAQDVWKSYPGVQQPLEVLRGVALRLAHGEAAAITGPSGSGKSTLLHLIGALDAPTRGRITLDGRCPHELPEAELARFRNRNVGFVFQDHHLLPQYTVIQNVLLPLVAALARPAPERVQRARELIAAVGLEQRITHRPAELSGGERQRVAIARALVNEPGLLLCDEPTGNLDGKTAAAVSDLLFQLHQRAGNILVIVTHSLALAQRCARRFELLDGRLEEPSRG